MTAIRAARRLQLRGTLWFYDSADRSVNEILLRILSKKIRTSLTHLKFAAESEERESQLACNRLSSN